MCSSDLDIVAGADKGRDVFLLAEVMAEATYVRHHVKKIAFLFSAMRHFAQALRNAGHAVRHVALEDDGNTQSLDGEILRAVQALKPERVAITEPGEWRLCKSLESLRSVLPVPLDILPDTRFLCTHAEFNAWAEGRRELRMEYFYREMRRRHHLLMEPDGKPSGGRWNYDAENRKPPKAGLDSPKRPSFRKDATTLEVLELVRRRFPDGYGRLEPFYFAVTRQQALRELIHRLLARFIGIRPEDDASAGERCPVGFVDRLAARRPGCDHCLGIELGCCVCGLLALNDQHGASARAQLLEVEQWPRSWWCLPFPAGAGPPEIGRSTRLNSSH